MTYLRTKSLRSWSFSFSAISAISFPASYLTYISKGWLLVEDNEDRKWGKEWVSSWYSVISCLVCRVVWRPLQFFQQKIWQFNPYLWSICGKWYNRIEEWFQKIDSLIAELFDDDWYISDKWCSNLGIRNTSKYDQGKCIFISYRGLFCYLCLRYCYLLFHLGFLGRIIQSQKDSPFTHSSPLWIN